MTIDCAFFGFLAADAAARTSKAGKPWTRLLGRDDDVQWVNVAVFGSAAETAAALKKGDRVYCEGVIKLDTWTGNDGGLALALAADVVRALAFERSDGQRMAFYNRGIGWCSIR